TYSTSTNVLIKIVNVTDGGNNLYIDNINLGAIPTGLEDQDASDYSLLLYPNPANTFFTIEYQLPKSENVFYEIMDITGRKIISSEAIKQSEGFHQVSVQTGELSVGMYYVKMKIGNQTATKKILINK
ncbi:MAG TPA: T9SS type A sorting domain-containing protein, partial [Bacteroidia bacterium]|nr:T9SS type A sorting domain-containing protein [Bacteroidia bacterium]